MLAEPQKYRQVQDIFWEALALLDKKALKNLHTLKRIGL